MPRDAKLLGQTCAAAQDMFGARCRPDRTEDGSLGTPDLSDRFVAAPSLDMQDAIKAKERTLLQAANTGNSADDVAAELRALAQGELRRLEGRMLQTWETYTLLTYTPGF